MSFARAVIEPVEKTVTVEEQTGVELYLTNDEAEFLLVVLGNLPGNHAHTKPGDVNQNLYDSLSPFVKVSYLERKYRASGSMEIVEQDHDSKRISGQNSN